MRIITLLISYFTMMTVSLYSQTGASHIYGTIVDPCGLPIRGVIVTLANDHIGEFTEKSSKKGKFRFLNLVPGTYRLKLEKLGLKTFDKKNLILATREKLRIKVTITKKNSQEEGQMTINRELKEVRAVGERIILPSVKRIFLNPFMKWQNIF